MIASAIVAVTGTGTGIGKTHVACALLGALRDRGVRAIGFKPVESGVDGGGIADEALLREASQTLPAGVRTIRLAAPLAPNVAARREGVTIEVARIRAAIAELAAQFDAVVLELAGGLFSPLTDELDNAALLAELAPRVAVVAPDRLGVLHDAAATVRAARAIPLALHALVLSAPAVADASTGTNAGELAHLGLPVVGIPRLPISALRAYPSLVQLASTMYAT